MEQYGLLGFPLSHSFSKKNFTEKFEREGIDAIYENYSIEDIAEVKNIVTNTKNLKGLNVTIPHKEVIIPFLDKLDESASGVGAVNTIKVDKNGLTGYNTDTYGFENALKPLLKKQHNKALILGTGGASKAIKYVLNKLNIEFISASIEELKENEIHYEDITSDIIKERTVIINATPLGTFPKVDTCPNIPYKAITDEHILFDLVYNPEVTLFLQQGKEKGAQIKNGLEMLQLQAARAWEIWNS